MISRNFLDMVLSVVNSNYASDADLDLIAGNRSIFSNCTMIAKRNGLYYRFINEFMKRHICLPFLDANNWNSELERLSEFKKSINLINHVSKKYNFDYILIKDCNTIEHVPRDIDIFIREGDSLRAIEAFKENGMRYVESSITEMILQQEGYVDIEIYNKINYLGKDYIDESYIFDSILDCSIFGINYHGMDSNANLILTLIHDLVGHRRITLLDFLHIENIMSDADIDKCRQYTLMKGWQNVFDLAIDELNRINNLVIVERVFISFPYIFPRSFMMKCFSLMGNLTSNRSRFIIYLSLIQDGIVEQIKKTILYDFIKSNKPIDIALASFINSINFKKYRGDKHK